MHESNSKLMRMDGGEGKGMIGDSGGGELVQHLAGSMLDGFDEVRSVSDNLDAASGEETSIVAVDEGRAPKRKKYHRHTPQQIQELEAFYKECPHPDEKQRLELSRRLNLEIRQVKFWFQNRRTQMKTQFERHENMLLKKENDRLRFEQMTLKNALRNPICTNCGGPVAVPDVSIDEQSLRVENERLREELTRTSLLTEKFLGRPISSIATPMDQMTNFSLDFSLGNTMYDGMNLLGHASPIGVLPALEVQLDNSLILQLALTAMDELTKIATATSSLWSRGLDGSKEVLNYDEYVAIFPPVIGAKPNNFLFEASREAAVICVNSKELVDTFMDVNLWVQMFPSLVARAATADVISPGINGTKNGMVLLMQAELQVLSPLVPLRQVKFLRFCKQHEDGMWAVVDLSVDTVHDGSSAFSPYLICRRLPSGCIVQEMPNGYSKVTWIEHTQYDETAVHPLYRPLISSALGFGAQRWLASLQRQYDSLEALRSSTIPIDNPLGMTSSGKQSLFRLAQRMTDNFCSGICASPFSKWETIYPGIVGEESVQLMSRKTLESPGEPAGIVLSATASVSMPVGRERLFDFLRDKRYRTDWDILSNGGHIQEVTNISKGLPGNFISLLSCKVSPNQNNMLLLQETWTDATSSLVVYAPVDTPAIHSVLNGGDSTNVALLPSGFAIYPDASSQAPNIFNENTASSRCLLTAGFQILVNELPTAKLTVDSIHTVENLIRCTIEKINLALDCTDSTHNP